MKFCQPHWEQLRGAIKAVGLDALIAESGQKAASNLQSESTDGPTVDNFDPLMGAHNAIVARSMKEIARLYSQNPLMLFADEKDHPDWACPICALDWCHNEHDRLCVQVNCDYPRSFDWAAEMCDGAARLMLAQWRELGGKTNAD